MSGAILNIILDPIFIFAFKWGMMGAAVATVLGQILTTVLAVWYICHLKSCKLEKTDFLLKGSVLGKSLVLGITSFLSQISLVEFLVLQTKALCTQSLQNRLSEHIFA